MRPNNEWLTFNENSKLDILKWLMAELRWKLNQFEAAQEALLRSRWDE